jgi:hypothetical protein
VNASGTGGLVRSRDGGPATRRAERKDADRHRHRPTQLARRPRPCRDGAACFYFRRGRCRFDHSQDAPAPAPAAEAKRGECPICFDDMEVTIAVIPCGHTVCGTCADQVGAKCFTCAGPAQAKMRVFV